MADSQKPVFLYYGHADDVAWIKAIKNKAENAKKEMENLKKFLEPYKNIAGIVLESLTPQVIFNHLKYTTDNISVFPFNY